MRPDELGDRFEETFYELFTKLLVDHLGLTLIERRRQPRGFQGGKDLQFRWRDRQGRPVFWHFECKANERTVRGRDVADKLFDVFRSEHPIDVWCLTMATAQTSAWVDEMLPWIDANLSQPFVLETLGPDVHAIRDLYACEPELYRRQYGSEPSERAVARRGQILSELERFLDEATARARGRSSAPAGPWQLLAPAQMQAAPVPPQRAERFLCGLTATAPWAAVMQGWAVPRRSTIDRLVARILDAGPGLDFTWLVDAAGEGKSTVLKQVAWEIATRHDGWSVLWTEAASRPDATTLPVDLLTELPEGAKVLVCLDGTEGVSGARRLRDAADALAERGIAVFLLAADRGAAWNASRLPRELRRGLPPARRVERLDPLTRDEAHALARQLQAHGRLHHTSVEEALARLHAHKIEGDRSWLLPTLLELTDPGERGFDEILLDLLEQLRGEDAEGPLLLLLCASIAQGAGRALPETLAERIGDAHGGFDRALDVLTGDVARTWELQPDQRRPSDVLVTHHRVLAERFVELSATSAELERRLLHACRSLPASVAQDVSVDDMIPRASFGLFDAIIRYLAAEPDLLPAAERFLSTMVGLDERQIPTWSRLGDCRTAQFEQAVAARADAQRLELLAANARAAYRRGLEVAREVLDGSHPPPRPLAGHRLPREETILDTAWANLEIAVGRHSGDVALLERAAALCVCALQTYESVPLVATTLSHALFSLGEPQLAAKLVPIPRLFSPNDDDAALIDDLARMGHAIPAGGFELLVDVLAAIVPTRLLERWAAIGLTDSRDAQAELLLASLRRVAAWLPADQRERLLETEAQLSLILLTRPKL